MSEDVKLRGVAETMLQTLFARAMESQKKNHKIYDEKAIEIVQKLNYDFSNAQKDMLMSRGVIARTIVLDKMVKDYIAVHPDVCIINIACGLDTRFYRVDNGKIHWYNVDLPETMVVRERFLKESGRVVNIAASAMEESWALQVNAEKRDVLVIIEGLTMYLNEKDVKQILNVIDRYFWSVRIFMETMSPFAVQHVKEKSVEASQAKFSWGIKSGKLLKKMSPSFRFVRDVSLAEGMKEMMPLYRVLEKIPFVRNISNKISVLEK